MSVRTFLRAWMAVTRESFIFGFFFPMLWIEFAEVRRSVRAHKIAIAKVKDGGA